MLFDFAKQLALHLTLLIQLLLQGKNVLALDSFILDLIHDLTDQEDAESSDLAVLS